jgi:F-type H+-transporting ATPase subunit b
VLQIRPDLTILVQIVLFLCFMWAMNALLFRPARRVLDARDREIAGGREKASALEARVEEAIEHYGERIREAHLLGERERARLVQEAAAEEARIAAEGRAQAAEATARIEEALRRETASARGELEGRAREFAALIAERALGRRVVG